MSKLEQIKHELDQLKYLVNGFNCQEWLPITTDLESFLNEIKYTCGYVDCMIKHGLSIPPDPE